MRLFRQAVFVHYRRQFASHFQSAHKSLIWRRIPLTIGQLVARLSVLQCSYLQVLVVRINCHPSSLPTLIAAVFDNKVAHFQSTRHWRLFPVALCFALALKYSAPSANTAAAVHLASLATTMLRSPWFLSITAIALSASHVICQHLQTTVIRKYPFSEKCNHQDRLAIIKCEDDARNTWNVDDSTYYTSSRKFCCFVWETLACSVDVAQRCDTNYAAELSIVTEETLHSLCDYSSGSSSCTFPAWSWWPLVPIVLGCIAICGIVLFFAYPSNELVRSRTKTVLSQYDEEMAESAI